ASTHRSGSVDVLEARFFERLAHLVHVEAEHAGGQLGALVGFVVFTRLGGIGHLGGDGGRYHDHAVIVGADHVARVDVGAGADHRNVHRTEGRLDGALGADRLREDRELHLGQVFDVADTAVDDQALGAARHEAGRQQVAEEAVGAVGGHGGDDDVARLNLFGDDVHHPVVTGVQQHGNGSAAGVGAGVDGAHVGLHQADAAHRFVDGGDAKLGETLDRGL